MASQYSTVLSPLDQFMPRTYIRIFLIFAVKNFDTAIDALRLGLSRTYLEAPYLKGHVYSKPYDKNQLSIVWSDDDPAPDFSEILASDTLSYASLIKDGAALYHFQSSLCPVGTAPNYSTPECRAAVLAVSYSRIDGGLILSICMHHLVMDGTGFANLIRVIADNSRSKVIQEGSGLKLDPLEPMTRVDRLREFRLSGRGETKIQSWDHILQQHPEFDVIKPSSVLPKPSVVPKFPKGMSKIFRFPVARLVAAKEVLSKFTNPEILTTNTILSALIWSIITRIRFSRLGISHKCCPKLGFAINGRKQFGDGFFKDVPYFGNVNLFGLASIEFADIDAASKCRDPSQLPSTQQDDLSKLVPVINAIANAISRISHSHISEVIELVEKSPDVTLVTPGWKSRNGPDLTLTSWANMGLYECDFGDSIGQPQFVRVPYAEFDGLVIVLPRRRNVDEERIEAVIMLCEEDMGTIERDGVWSSWTS